jgi:hypothetical protein
MEVRLFPNSRRPGVGLRPRRESQRPFLPQHARHCPVLEAGSAVGFLVYPPLEKYESFYIGYQGDGQYQFTYYLSTPAGEWSEIFSVGVVLPVGSIGMIREEVEIKNRELPISRQDALLMARQFIVPEDLGTPPGAITLRGATNFQTPPGWDTVYTPIFNMIERPVAPMLVVRESIACLSGRLSSCHVKKSACAIAARRSWQRSADHARNSLARKPPCRSRPPMEFHTARTISARADRRSLRGH